MKALTFRGKHRIGYESIPDPEILSPQDVIVRVKVCAICGSDLHVYHEHEKGIDLGTAMGHEFSGEIVEVGREVKSLHKGDSVMSPFTTSCGECYYCRIGLTCRCEKGQLFGWVENGRGLQGGQSQYVRVPLAESTLMKIPDGVTPEEALLLGDVFSTGYFSALQAGIRREGTYVVVGCGPVGLMAIIGARDLGAEKIFAVDAVHARREKAREFGAIVVTPEAAHETIRAASNGRGADAVMEAVGHYSAVRTAWELVSPGGTISSVGVCTDPHLAFSPTEAYNKNLTYKIGRCPARRLMDELLPVILEKKYPIGSIFSHHMRLEEGVEGYEIFANKKDNCLKVLLTP